MRKTNKQLAEEWAIKELKNLNTPSNLLELEQDFKNFILYHKSRIHLDDQGNIKALEPWD